MTDILKSKLLSNLPGVEHGFGVGPCEIGDMVGPEMRVFETDQMHGRRVVRLEEVKDEGVIEADAFVTNAPGLVCHVRTADCVPILIADAKRRAVAAVHAGWRGTVLDIAGETIEEMRRAYGTDPADCVAAIGPCICGACYEVGREVVERLESLDLGRDWLVGDRRVDLAVANRVLLLRAGVARIDMLDLCTSCDHRFSSWRRDNNEGRQVNFILFNPSS